MFVLMVYFYDMNFMAHMYFSKESLRNHIKFKKKKQALFTEKKIFLKQEHSF